MRVTQRLVCFISLTLFAVSAAYAEVRTEAIDYQDGDVTLRGYLAFDDAIQEKRPGVLVVHEWWGLNDYARGRAEQLAELGYVAFALDMYGKDKVTEHPDQAGEWAKQVSTNSIQWQQRATRGLDILREDDRVDANRLAAIGYCFGGSTVMQLAYAGADLDGVVSFHGALPIPPENVSNKLQSKILIAHGNADAFIQPDHIAEFQTALDNAGADWQMVYYASARHGFTNPDAGQYGIDNLRYDKNADRRSWEHMQRFLDELFGSGG